GTTAEGQRPAPRGAAQFKGTESPERSNVPHPGRARRCQEPTRPLAGRNPAPTRDAALLARAGRAGRTALGVDDHAAPRHQTCHGTDPRVVDPPHRGWIGRSVSALAHLAVDILARTSGIARMCGLASVWPEPFAPLPDSSRPQRASHIAVPPAPPLGPEDEARAACGAHRLAPLVPRRMVVSAGSQAFDGGAFAARPLTGEGQPPRVATEFSDHAFY